MTDKLPKTADKSQSQSGTLSSRPLTHIDPDARRTERQSKPAVREDMPGTTPGRNLPRR